MIVSIENHVSKKGVNVDLIYLQKFKTVLTLSLHLTNKQFGTLLMDLQRKSVDLNMSQKETLVISL